MHRWLVLPASIIAVNLLAGCGTLHRTKIEKDLLTGANICYVSTLEQKDHVTTGNPGGVWLNTYADYKLEVMVDHYYPMVSVNKSNLLKTVKVRVDANPIVTLEDRSQNDDSFVIADAREIIEQMLRGRNMVLRVIYYGGHTKDFELDISKFSLVWQEMKEQC